MINFIVSPGIYTRTPIPYYSLFWDPRLLLDQSSLMLASSLIVDLVAKRYRDAVAYGLYQTLVYGRSAEAIRNPIPM